MLVSRWIHTESANNEDWLYYQKEKKKYVCLLVLFKKVCSWPFCKRIESKVSQIAALSIEKHSTVGQLTWGRFYTHPPTQQKLTGLPFLPARGRFPRSGVIWLDFEVPLEWSILTKIFGEVIYLLHKFKDIKFALKFVLPIWIKYNFKKSNFLTTYKNIQIYIYKTHTKCLIFL